MSHDFEMIEEYYYVYIKRSKNKFVILSLYVDDILITGNGKEHNFEIKGWLSSKFEVKDTCEAAYILGVKISRDQSKKLVSLSQEQYIKKALSNSKCKIVNPLILLWKKVRP